MTVRLPPGKTLADGPFPTLIEYSGYQTAAPNDLLSTSIGRRGRARPARPRDLDRRRLGRSPRCSTSPSSACRCAARAARAARSTSSACRPPTTATTPSRPSRRSSGSRAARSAMVGISFSGITQLFTAGTRPPHLAAIAPMSVTDDLYQGTGYPGGIFNKGFALSLDPGAASATPSRRRRAASRGRAIYGQGDKHCIANQKLRLQTQDALKLHRDNPFRTPSLFDDRAPGAWVKKHQGPDVPRRPVPGRADRRPLPREPQRPRTTSTTGIRSRTASTSTRSGRTRSRAGPSSSTSTSPTEVPVVPDSVLVAERRALPVPRRRRRASPVKQSRFAGDDRRRRGEGRLRAGPARAAADGQRRRPRLGPGSIGSAWELRFGAWPVRQAKADDYFLGAERRARAAKPAPDETADLHGRPDGAPAPDAAGRRRRGDAWKAQPPYNWTPLAAGKGVGFATAPLAKDVVIAGPSSLDAVPQVVGEATPTSRSRSPRSAPTATRPTSRTAGCARRTASSTRSARPRSAPSRRT